LKAEDRRPYGCIDRSDEVAKDKATSEIAELDRKIAELNHQFYHTLAREEEVCSVVPTNKKRKYH